MNSAELSDFLLMELWYNSQAKERDQQILVPTKQDTYKGSFYVWRELWETKAADQKQFWIKYCKVNVN